MMVCGLAACGQEGDVPPLTVDLPAPLTIYFTSYGTAPFVRSQIALFPDGAAIITEATSGVAGDERTRRAEGLIASSTRLNDRLERVGFTRIPAESTREIPAQDAERYEIRWAGHTVTRDQTNLPGPLRPVVAELKRLIATAR